MPTSTQLPALLDLVEANWQGEMEGPAIYKALATGEQDSRRLNMMRGLSAIEEQHAHLWADEIKVLNGPKPIRKGTGSGHAAFLLDLIDGSLSTAMGSACRIGNLRVPTAQWHLIQWIGLLLEETYQLMRRL